MSTILVVLKHMIPALQAVEAELRQKESREERDELRTRALVYLTKAQLLQLTPEQRERYCLRPEDIPAREGEHPVGE